MTCINAFSPHCANLAIHIPFFEKVMIRSYQIKPLSREKAAIAFPVIHAAYPNVTLDDWLAYFTWINQAVETRPFLAGIVSIEDARGYILGLFSYVTGYGLGKGAVLRVEHFVALDTGDRAAAIRRLITAMEDVAQRHGCNTIQTEIPEFWTTMPAGKYGVLAHLSDAGHARETVRFSKCLPPR